MICEAYTALFFTLLILHSSLRHIIIPGTHSLQASPEDSVEQTQTPTQTPTSPPPSINVAVAINVNVNANG
jgi:hypothetical protein